MRSFDTRKVTSVRTITMRANRMEIVSVLATYSQTETFLDILCNMKLEDASNLFTQLVEQFGARAIDTGTGYKITKLRSKKTDDEIEPSDHSYLSADQIKLGV